MGEGDRPGLSGMVIPAISFSRKELPEAVPRVFSQQEASKVRQQKRKKKSLSPQERAQERHKGGMAEASTFQEEVTGPWMPDLQTSFLVPGMKSKKKMTHSSVILYDVHVGVCMHAHARRPETSIEYLLPRLFSPILWRQKLIAHWVS